MWPSSCVAPVTADRLVRNLALGRPMGTSERKGPSPPETNMDTPFTSIEHQIRLQNATLRFAAQALARLPRNLL